MQQREVKGYHGLLVHNLKGKRPLRQLCPQQPGREREEEKVRRRKGREMEAD